MMTIK